MIKDDIKLMQTYTNVMRLVSKRYKFNEEFQDENNISSDISFVIRAVSENDFGVYNCTIGNSFGENSFIFEVQPKRELNSHTFLRI